MLKKANMTWHLIQRVDTQGWTLSWHGPQGNAARCRSAGRVDY
jgi:hypothetical protein